jgi:hypothetical protein
MGCFVISDETIVALVLGLGGFVIGLVYYLNSATRKIVDNVGQKIEHLAVVIGAFKEAFAARSVEIDWIKAELDTVKKRCWDCEQFRKKIQK